MIRCSGAMGRKANYEKAQDEREGIEYGFVQLGLRFIIGRSKAVSLDAPDGAIRHIFLNESRCVSTAYIVELLSSSSMSQKSFGICNPNLIMIRHLGIFAAPPISLTEFSKTTHDVRRSPRDLPSNHSDTASHIDVV